MISIPLPDRNITRYIPQREPIIMVDELMESNSISTVTAFEIKEKGFFVKDGKLQEPGLIENIAQTAAAGAGYRFALHQESVPPGFIAAIKNLRIEALPLVGESLITKVEILEKVFDITLIKGEIVVANQCIAVCEMKIVQKRD